MPHSQRDSQNAAWQAAHQWRARATQAQPTGLLGALKLVLIWLTFGALMVVGVVFALFFLLLGWAMMPFLRHRMKKRMDQMRAERAQDIGGGEGFTHGEHPKRDHQAIEGSFEVKEKR